MTYISDMNFFLNCSGVSEDNYEQILSKREKFQNYPFYLKHTLFQEDEEIKRIRNSSFENKIKASFENISIANEIFQKEKYSEALTCYERV